MQSGVIATTCSTRPVSLIEWVDITMKGKADLSVDIKYDVYCQLLPSYFVGGGDRER